MEPPRDLGTGFARGPPPRGMSLEELGHLAGSVVVLAVAFSFALTNQGLLYTPVMDWDAILAVLPYAAAIVVTAFVLHELAHKFVAERYRLLAEFRASLGGLGLALVVSAATGFVLAAPGAVVIVGRATERESGVISLVGPLVNLTLGFLALPLAFTSPGSPYYVAPLPVGVVGNIFQVIVFINLFLAAFNLLPVRPLDGSKIWRWNKPAYLGALVLVATLASAYLAGYSPL